MSGGSVASKRKAVAREMIGTPFEGKVGTKTSKAKQLLHESYWRVIRLVARHSAG